MEVTPPLTREWIDELAREMEANTRDDVPRRISKILSAKEVEKLFAHARRALKSEKTSTRLEPSDACGEDRSARCGRARSGTTRATPTGSRN